MTTDKDTIVLEEPTVSHTSDRDLMIRYHMALQAISGYSVTRDRAVFGMRDLANIALRLGDEP
jgi:hypothetical protein